MGFRFEGLVDTNLVYRAALTAFGLIGNAYILGNQITSLKGDIGDKSKEMKDDFHGQMVIGVGRDRKMRHFVHCYTTL